MWLRSTLPRRTPGTTPDRAPSRGRSAGTVARAERVTADRVGLARPDAGTRDQSIWQNREFLLLWLAQAISQTAQNAIWYGIVVLVQRQGHSSTLLSVAVLTLIIPSVIFGVLAGVYVDRWDKRAVLIGTNLLRGGMTVVQNPWPRNLRSIR